MDEIKRLRDLSARLTGNDIDEDAITLWQPIDQQSNRIYSIKFDNFHWIAKVFLKPAEFDDAPRREYAAMQLLSPLDIAPQPIHYAHQNETQNPIVIYEFMAGQMWDRYRPSRDELQQLAHIWNQMTRMPVENLWLSRGMDRTAQQVAEQFEYSFQEYARWAEVNFPQGKETASILQEIGKTYAPIVERVFAMEPVLCFSRADPRFANVIQRPDHRLGMIDWEDSGLRDVARDIADIMAHPNQEDLVSREDWQAFIEPILAERRQYDPEIDQRVHLYQAVFPLFWLSGLIAYGIRRWHRQGLRDWTINTMDPNQRLRRYLARVMSWDNQAFDDALQSVGELEFFDVP